MNKRQEQERRAEAKSIDMDVWTDKKSPGGWEPTYCALPQGTEFFKLKEEGTFTIDVVQYTAGPFNMEGDEGYRVPRCTYFSHRIPTPDGNHTKYLCFETFKDPKGRQRLCPCCVWRKATFGDADLKEVGKKMFKQEWAMWWVRNYADKELKFRVFDVQHENRGQGFGEQIKQAIGIDRRRKNFAAPDGSHTLVLVTKENYWPGGKFYPITRIEFVDRKDTYDLDLPDKLPQLDRYLFPCRPPALKGKFLQDYTEEDWAACQEEMRAILEGLGGVAVGGKKQVTVDQLFKPPPTHPKAPASGNIPAARKSQLSAEELGLAVGDHVAYEGEEAEIIELYEDGTADLIKVTDDPEEAEDWTAVPLTELGKLAKKPTKPAAAPVKAAAPTAPDEDDEEEEDYEDEEDEEEDEAPPKPRRSRR
jgi:hypothetical protein